jgi:two-component system, chemotaxis family, chemotaxis protein CheY
MEIHECRLLIADDSDSMRRVVRGILMRLGFVQIDEAEDGVEALRLFKRAPYDLVVTDLAMPNMGGIELLREIRAVPDRRYTPVLIVSGQLSEPNLREALDAGVDGFVAKPYVEGALTEKVARLLLRRIQRQPGSDVATGALQSSAHGATGPS